MKEPDFEPPDSDIYAVSASGGAITKVASIDGPIQELSLSPDGRRIAFVGEISHDGTLARSYSQPDLFVTGVATRIGPMNLTADYDFDIEGGVGGDQSPPRGGSQSKPWWSADGREIFSGSAEEGRANLKRVNAETGKVAALTEGRLRYLSLISATPDGSKIAWLISTPTNIGDLFLSTRQSGQYDGSSPISTRNCSQSST